VFETRLKSAGRTRRDTIYFLIAISLSRVGVGILNSIEGKNSRNSCQKSNCLSKKQNYCQNPIFFPKTKFGSKI